MRKGDWIALGVIAVGAYLVVRAKSGASAAAPLKLTITSGNGIVGFLDTTDQVQYDPATGNLWDTSGGDNVFLATVDTGRDQSVFLDPQVRAVIATARGTA